MEMSTSEKIKLGIFVILGTSLLIVAAYLIGNRQNMFGKNFTISSVFRHVGGLQKGNNVRYSGINVGTVKDIEMEQDTVIRVYMLIEENMRAHLKLNAVATIGSDGLVGSMILNILPGEGESRAIRPGDEIRSYSRFTTTDLLSTLNVTNENAALLTSDLLDITASLRNGEGVLGRLLNDPKMSEDLVLTTTNLRLASQEAHVLLTDLTGIFKDENLKHSVAGILLTDSLAANRVDTMLIKLQQSSMQLDHSLKTLDTLVTDLADGEGALQYLAHDTIFIRRLSTTMKNIEEGSAKFNENMEALKHNFLTRRYFRKLERQQAKQKEK